jgi:hypothetical protein
MGRQGENGVRFLLQHEDLYMKCCILEENSKNTTSGRTKHPLPGWILLDNSSYDEYSEPLKSFGGST